MPSILHTKSWHPGNASNRGKVEQDEREERVKREREEKKEREDRQDATYVELQQQQQETFGMDSIECIFQRGNQKLYIARGSVVDAECSAIVNAANEGCIGGGGVDGAINAAGGKALHRARRALPEQGNGVRCKTGDAVFTIGGELKASFVIHAVGPDCRDLDDFPHSEREAGRIECLRLIASAYTRALEVATSAAPLVSLPVKSIAFSLVSAGVYRGDLPLVDILRVGLAACETFLSSSSAAASAPGPDSDAGADAGAGAGAGSALESIVLVGFNGKELAALKAAWASLHPSLPPSPSSSSSSASASAPALGSDQKKPRLESSHPSSSSSSSSAGAGAGETLGSALAAAKTPWYAAAPAHSSPASASASQQGQQQQQQQEGKQAGAGAAEEEEEEEEEKNEGGKEQRERRRLERDAASKAKADPMARILLNTGPSLLSSSSSSSSSPSHASSSSAPGPASGPAPGPASALGSGGAADMEALRRARLEREKVEGSKALALLVARQEEQEQQQQGGGRG